MPTDPTGVMGLSSRTAPATSASASLSGPERETARIKKAAQEFEGVFVGMMLKQMRKSMTGASPLFGGSSQAKIYQDMMDDMTAQQLSKTSPFGLAKTLERSMLARQGHPENKTQAVVGKTAPLEGHEEGPGPVAVATSAASADAPAPSKAAKQNTVNGKGL